MSNIGDPGLTIRQQLWMMHMFSETWSEKIGLDLSKEEIAEARQFCEEGCAYYRKLLIALENGAGLDDPAPEKSRAD